MAVDVAETLDWRPSYPAHDGYVDGSVRMLSYCDARQPRMFPDYHHGHHMPPYAAPRPRMDPASDVFTCLFGDLFVKW